MGPKVSADNELMDMPRVALRAAPPLAIGLAYSVTPCLVGFLVLRATGSGWDELLLLALWHIWAWHIAAWPAPMSTLRGALTSAVTLIFGVMSMHKMGNNLIRAQYVMATIMFVAGRGNVLVNDAYLRSLPLGFRGAYLFCFLDLGKATYFESAAECKRGWQSVRMRMLMSALGCASTVALLALVHTYWQTGDSVIAFAAREAVKVSAGSLNFILGIYFADALYSVPVFAFAPSPVLTLKPQPLMIRPWRSQTIREWWSKRFDTGMQSVLYYNAYRPVRKVGLSRGVAMFSTFILSGLIHCPLIFELGASTRDLAMMFAFFLVQGLYVAIEDLMKWGPNRLRTFCLLFASAPLFTFPVINRMGFN
jgi:hypothetical protein